MAQIMPKLHLAFGGAESPEGDGLYASPAGRSFYSCKRNQNTLGAVPQDPLTLSCGWIRTMPRHRPYSAADTLSRCLRRIFM